VPHALSIDIEDYFQTEAMSSAVPREEWGTAELRVERSTWRLLEMFERRKIHTTMFFLGWVADRCPGLVRAAASYGHEVACHSYWHRTVYSLSPTMFREDTIRAKGAIESVTGQAIIGYRAPSFSILENMEWATDILAESGFQYSSSTHPILHDTYSNPNANRLPHQTRSGIWEIPITTWPIFGSNLPVGGGAYLRILPSQYVLTGLKQVADKGETLMIYLHPWEIDFDQPKLSASRKSQARQYIGLNHMERRLERLIDRYTFSSIASAFENELHICKPLGFSCDSNGAKACVQ